MADDTTSASGSSTAADLAQVIAPLAAVVAVIASLAAAGVISAAQRNHGGWLLLALGLVSGAAALWLIAVLLPAVETPPAPQQIERVEGQTPFGGFDVKWWTESQNPPSTEAEQQETSRTNPGRGTRLKKWTLTTGRLLLRIFAIVLLLAGLVIATTVMIDTQNDSQRPSVSATFDSDKGVLSATVTAEGLKTDQRMSVRVSGLKQTAPLKDEKYVEVDHKPLYFALLGPDGSGDVNYPFKVYVPPAYNIVQVEAWATKTRPGCLDVTSRRQSEESGCAIIRLKPNRKP